eukprot:3660989-Prorocentrum_lima.AAC.1
MCIRDRLNASHQPVFFILHLKGLDAFVSGVTPSLMSTSQTIQGFLQPVSYTHLTLPTICSV